MIAFAGIGNPTGFLHTVRSLGMQVSLSCWFDDHHNYDAEADLRPLEKASRERHIDAWITTLKDWVKIRGQAATENPGNRPPIWHVRIESRLRPHEQELLRARLAALTLSPPA